MQTQTPSFLNIGDAKATIKRLQVRLLQIILLFVFLASIFYDLSFLASGENPFEGTNIIAPLSTVVMAVLFVMISRAYLINIIGTFVIMYLLSIGIYMFTIFENASLLFLLLTLAMVTTALVSTRIVFRLLTILVVAIIVWTALQPEASSLEFGVTSISLLLALGIVPVGLGMLSRYFVEQITQIATQAHRSVSLLSASADIGNDVSQMLELNVLLDRAVEIVRDRFAFYHVSIFLIDEGERYAHLTASTGEVGERMLARGHRLPVNSESVVGRAAQAKDLIIARDTDSESGHSFNELLPFTRSELAVPIVDNDGIVGVVDVQSRRPDAFIPTEIEALRVIVNQLATAIRNARLFEDKERSIRENKRLFIEAETNLREIQRLNRQLTKQAWADYLRTNHRIDGVTLKDENFRNTAEWSDEMINASRRRRAITAEKDGKRKVAVPIELRGEVVGAIELEANPNTQKDDLVDMVRSVSQRLAVSLDNARLFEESNEATAQEQRVSEIVAQYQAADSVDELLRVTLQGLAETLGAEQASIRLGAVPDVDSLDSYTETLDPENKGDEPYVS